MNCLVKVTFYVDNKPFITVRELLVIFHCAFSGIINNTEHAACDLSFSQPVHDAPGAYALSTFNVRQTEQCRSPISLRLFQNYLDSKFVENFFFSILSVSESESSSRFRFTELD